MIARIATESRKLPVLRAGTAKVPSQGQFQNSATLQLCKLCSDGDGNADGEPADEQMVPAGLNISFHAGSAAAVVLAKVTLLVAASPAILNVLHNIS